MITIIKSISWDNTRQGERIVFFIKKNLNEEFGANSLIENNLIIHIGTKCIYTWHFFLNQVGLMQNKKSSKRYESRSKTIPKYSPYTLFVLYIFIKSERHEGINSIFYQIN